MPQSRFERTTYWQARRLLTVVATPFPAASYCTAVYAPIFRIDHTRNSLMSRTGHRILIFEPGHAPAGPDPVIAMLRGKGSTETHGLTHLDAFPRLSLTGRSYRRCGPLKHRQIAGMFIRKNLCTATEPVQACGTAAQGRRTRAAAKTSAVHGPAAVCYCRAGRIN